MFVSVTLRFSLGALVLQTGARGGVRSTLLTYTPLALGAPTLRRRYGDAALTLR